MKKGRAPLPGMAQANRVLDKLRLRRALAALRGLPARLKLGGLASALKRIPTGLKGMFGKLRPKRAA